ncbi:Hypothetical predicted protein, partial [Scomber scombrus]
AEEGRSDLRIPRNIPPHPQHPCVDLQSTASRTGATHAHQAGLKRSIAGHRD